MKEPQPRIRSKLNICIDTTLKEEMISFANNDGRSVSWIVESALRDFLQKLGMKVPPKGPGRLRFTGATKALMHRGNGSTGQAGAQNPQPPGDANTVPPTASTVASTVASPSEPPANS